jgi:putative endonuclease
MKTFHIYILASRSRVLYVGVTGDLRRRMDQHERGEGSDFTRKYRTDYLVYCELCEDARAAIQREKQIKGWTRAKKIALIESANPDGRDLKLDL